MNGRIDTAPVAVRVELFAREAGAGSGEADRYIDDVLVNADAAGEGTFSHNVDIAEFGLDLDVGRRRRGDGNVHRQREHLGALARRCSDRLGRRRHGRGDDRRRARRPSRRRRASSSRTCRPRRSSPPRGRRSSRLRSAPFRWERSRSARSRSGAIPLGRDRVPRRPDPGSARRCRALDGAADAAAVVVGAASRTRLWPALPLQSLSLQQALDALAAQPDAASAASRSGRSGCGTTCSGRSRPRRSGSALTPLGSIDIGDEGADEPGDSNLEDWCEWLSGPPVNCTDPDDLQPESVLSTSLRGVPLGAIPLGAIPLGSIPLGAIPLGAIPLGSIDIEFSPLGCDSVGRDSARCDPARRDPAGLDPARRDQPAESPLGCDPARRDSATGLIEHLHLLPELSDGRRAEGSRGAAEDRPHARAVHAGAGPAALGNVTFADILLFVADATLDDFTVRQLVETLLLVPEQRADVRRPARRVPGRELARLGAAQPRSGECQPDRRRPPAPPITPSR